MQNKDDDNKILDKEYIKNYIKNFNNENIEENKRIYSPNIDEKGKTIVFYKENKNNKIWWVDNSGIKVGVHEFSFDKKKIYNLFRDYPYNLTKEEKKIFDKENPYWAVFFKDR